MRDIWWSLWVLSMVLFFIFPRNFVAFIFFLSIAGMVADWYIENSKKQSDPRKMKNNRE